MKAERKRIIIKTVSVFVSLNMLFQIFYPTAALALTGGPSQPEMQGFEPIGTTNMVDLSTGSFTYNIPLMDVEGYPINLSYHSGITMDQEASWVGLGWNINPGEINRQMRGIPDDFKGDAVTQNFNKKDNITVGFNAGVGFKIAGLPLNLNLSLGIFNNNYKGPGITLGVTPSIAAGVGNKGSLTGSLGINFNSQSGVDVSPSIGFSQEVASDKTSSTSLGMTVGASYNSRSGLKGITMSKDLSAERPKTSKNGTNDDASASLGSSFMSFSSPTYIPTMSMPLLNNSGTLHATIGLGFFTLHPNLTVSGYYNQQTLATKTLTLPAYGYMYADQAENNIYAMHDFNREKDIPFTQSIANLPITNFTYDLYSINGQGVSGQFRPFRGDVGILYDHECTNQSTSYSLGIELGFTEVSHNGIDLNYTNSNTTTGQWLNDNDFASKVSFQSMEPGTISYEPFYIKGVGEKTINDATYYNNIENLNPMYVHLDRFGSDVRARNIFNYSNTTAAVTSNLTKSRRDKRSQSTSILTASEATYFGLDKVLKSYPYNKSVYDSGCSSLKGIDSFPRTTWPAHHISELTVTKSDGKRYVYGLPAYNTVHNEATFAVSSTVSSYSADSVNVVPYSAGSDNSTGNTKGRDNYYNEQYLPPYAHSYLLTGVLSPDYVDLTNNGISDDDLGEAVKINYTQMYSQAAPYQWRVPVESDTASYQVGLLTDNSDDKGNYLYGQKEIWYTHSIESKTMVAQFILQPREDALGVKGENGGVDTTKKLQCLKEIDLYSKADLIKNGSKAVPIKTVHFVYSYSLCPGTPNSNASGKGKLTLTKVYFTYGNNTEGALNSYQFTYSSFNPSFNHNRYDKWGYYKYNTSGMPSNEDFPYTLQDSARTNKFATAWNMTGISLPSGGQISVNYQSNDYAYVQNQRAGEMFTILGMANTWNGALTSQLYGYSNNDWIVVRLPTHCYAHDSAHFNSMYLSGVGSLYFRFLVDINGKSNYEYVPGYANMSGYRRINDSTWSIAVADFNTGDIAYKSANPIAAAAWQFARLNMPQLAYPGSTTSGGVLGVIDALAGILYDVIDIFVGFDGRVASENFGRYIIPSHSWIRLDNPNYKKLGGGARVSEIDIADNWASMASGQKSFKYGQTFNYTTTLGTQTISSGVATYEPLVGGDENPLRQPLPYADKYKLAPNNEMYTETPLGESLYPSPGIVYSKVTVTNLKYPGVERTATGSTVNEFYTAYDFPTQNSYTSLDEERIKPSILSEIFSFNVKDYMNASQGFQVICNDMAGKEKSQEVYDENGALISSVHNYFQVSSSNSPSMTLNNSVQVINANGSISTATVGQDIDVWEDMREQETQTQGFGATINNDFFIFPFIAVPVDVPDVFPDYSCDHSRFRSSVTTKYVYQAGILDSVVKTQYGSSVTTKNLLYDGETGDVLLTQTKNEFDAPVYNFTYPAHWAYDGMGPAYQNIGFQVNGVTITNGALSISSPSLYFSPGDELEYYTSAGVLSNSKLWVTQPASNLIVMDASGKPANLTNVNLKIIRSGRRNMSGMPVCTLASLVSPISGSSISVSASSKIIQASGTLFSNQWRIPTTNVTAQVCNPLAEPPDSCLAKFVDSIITHKQLFATPGDSIKFGKYINGTNCGSDGPLNANTLYYSLVDPVGMPQMSSFQAQLGNCTMTITSFNGHPIYLDSLTPYRLPRYFTLGPKPKPILDDTTGGCINLYYNRSYLQNDFYNPVYPLVGEICMSCANCHDTCRNITIDSVFNPYAVGLLGNWRPYRNYVYYDTLRAPVYSSTKSDIWKNGIFQRFTNLWTPPVSGTVWSIDTADNNWTWTSQITKYDPKGNEIEDEDALGRFSGALYGYLQSLPTAVASNAKYQEIAFDGFEDYGFNTTCSNLCNWDHFSFRDIVPGSYVDTTTALAHTGRYSLKVTAGHSATETRYIHYYESKLDSINSAGTEFIMLPGGSIPLFAPDSGNYLISTWVNENATCGATGYKKDSIIINFSGSAAQYVFHAAGPVIEGWQRFEGRFKVPKTATAINVSLVAGSNGAYFDDIRMEPFAAEMKTYVYDPFSLRLLATLDENNYATIYEYNDEGILMRVKKETERGIMTIKESRSSYRR